MFDIDEFSKREVLSGAEAEAMLMRAAVLLRERFKALEPFTEVEVTTRIKELVGMNADYYQFAATEILAKLRDGVLDAQVRGGKIVFKTNRP